MSGARYYWSGSNRAGEIRALAKHGMHIGVCVSELDRAGRAEAELLACKDSESSVFVDSGAFSEVTFGAHGPVYPRPIDDDEWRRRLEVYERLAAALGGRCMVVAPDRVGDQRETLRRLAFHRESVAKCRSLGAGVVVPLQRGTMTAAEFDQACSEALGFSDYIRGIPSKKSAATTDEIAALARELPAGTRVHLLGLGPWSPRYSEVMQALNMPFELISCDSCRIKSLVGHSNGAGGGPRLLTACTSKVRRELGLQCRARGAEAEELKFRALDRCLSRLRPQPPALVQVSLPFEDLA